MNFTLINGITESDIKRSEFVIYAHTCSKGTYVGMSSDPVIMWQSYCTSAFNEYCPSYKLPFRAAIRSCKNRFRHYILAVSNSEVAAKNKKAAAIKFYSDKLNTRNEVITNNRDYNFSCFNNSLGKLATLSKLKKKGNDRYSDSDRKTVIAEIYRGNGRKRVRTIKGQKFPAGINITCSREERENFEIGDLVRINVAMAHKPSGGEYLVAARTTKFIKV